MANPNESLLALSRKNHAKDLQYKTNSKVVSQYGDSIKQHPISIA